MKVKKILSRRSLFKREDKVRRRQRSLRMRSLPDEDAGVVFWEAFCALNGWPKEPTIANIRRYTEVFVNVKEEKINRKRHLFRGDKGYISGFDLFIKPVHRLRAQLLSAQNVAAQPVTIAHVVPAPNMSSNGNIHANNTSQAATCSAYRNNKNPTPELDTDSEDFAEDGSQASLKVSAPSTPLRSSRKQLMPPPATKVSPLRQETILPSHTHGSTDVVARPHDTARSAGSAVNAGALDDKYPQFKAQEFKLGLSQSLANIETYPYRICRKINTTVPDVLQEWRHGLHGHPAIQTLNNTFKAKWRVSADKTVYRAKLGVVKEYIRLVLTEGRSNTDAIETLELRRRNKAIVTLHKDILKAGEGKKSSIYGKDEPDYPKELPNQAGRAPKPPAIEETNFPLPVRQIHSIPNVWEEWEVGWKGAQPIKSLIDKHKRAWNNPDFKVYENHFRYRNQLVRTIREAVNQDAVKTHEDAILILEARRGAREPSTFCKSKDFKSLLENEWRITTAVKEYWKCGKYQ